MGWPDFYRYCRICIFFRVFEAKTPGVVRMGMVVALVHTVDVLVLWPSSNVVVGGVNDFHGYFIKLRR